MKTYRIYQNCSTRQGSQEHLIGVYDAMSKEGAIEAMCREFGFRSLAHAAADAGETMEQYQSSLFVERT